MIIIHRPCGIALKVLNDEGIAGDVLQEIFLKIWRGIERYDSDKGVIHLDGEYRPEYCHDTLRSKSHKSGTKAAEFRSNVLASTSWLFILQQITSDW